MRPRPNIRKFPVRAPAQGSFFVGEPLALHRRGVEKGASDIQHGVAGAYRLRHPDKIGCRAAGAGYPAWCGGGVSPEASSQNEDVGGVVPRRRF